MDYTIQIGTGSAVAPAALGVTGGDLTYRANGFDSLEIDVAADLDAAAVFADKAKVTLRQGSAIVFVGEVVIDPRTTVVDGPSHHYSILSYLARLDRHNFGQKTKVYSGSPAALGEVWDPLVTLGQDADGARCTAAAQIAAVLDFAAAEKGVPVSYVAGTWPAGFQAPLDQRENIPCWEAIVCQLRWMPDYVLWCDYSSGSTVVRLLPSDSLAVVTVDADDGILETARLSPRRDLVLPGVRCLFRRVDEYDGKEREVRLFQSAGDPDDPDAKDIFVDLEGSSTTTISQKVAVAPYPSFDSVDYDGDVRTWLIGRVPWLADIDAADWSITNIVRSGAEAYENELVEGSICGWMPVSEEFEVVTCTVEYATKDVDGKYVDKATVKLPVACRSTDATSKTYRKKVAFQAPETPPTGLAAGIFAAWSVLHWDGTFASDMDVLGWSCRPGARINLLGGPAEWETMAALVQEFSLSLDDDSCGVRLGTCRAIEADSMVALHRALRGRRFAYKRSVSSATAEAPAAMEGPESFPSDASADSPAFARRFLRVADTVGTGGSALAHDVTVNPSAILFASDAHKAAQDIKLREVVVSAIDPVSGTPIAKRAQALCGAPYGDAIPLGTSIPNGTAEGQTLIWNATSGAWEARAKCVLDFKLNKSTHKFQLIYSDAPTTWVDVSDANGGILDPGLTL